MEVSYIETKCLSCGKVKRHYARGLCIRCYQKPYNDKYKSSVGYKVKRSQRDWYTVQQARSKLQRAIKKGIIKRGKCAICNESKVEGHHYDYDKPFDVIWLCRKHHNMLRWDIIDLMDIVFKIKRNNKGEIIKEVNKNE